MQNITKLELKKTNLKDNYRLILNIGDIISNGYLVNLTDLVNIKTQIDNIIKEKV